MDSPRGRYVAEKYDWDGVWESGPKWGVFLNGEKVKSYSVYNPLAKFLAKIYAWRHNR